MVGVVMPEEEEEEEEEKVRVLLLLLLVKGKGEGKGLLRERAGGVEEEDKVGADAVGEFHETVGGGAQAGGMNAQNAEEEEEAEGEGERGEDLLLLLLLLVPLVPLVEASVEARGQYPPPRDQVMQRRTTRRKGGCWLMPRPRLGGWGREGEGGREGLADKKEKTRGAGMNAGQEGSFCMCRQTYRVLLFMPWGQKRVLNSSLLALCCRLAMSLPLSFACPCN